MSLYEPLHVSLFLTLVLCVSFCLCLPVSLSLSVCLCAFLSVSEALSLTVLSVSLSLPISSCLCLYLTHPPTTLTALSPSCCSHGPNFSQPHVRGEKTLASHPASIPAIVGDIALGHKWSLCPAPVLPLPPFTPAPQRPHLYGDMIGRQSLSSSTIPKGHSLLPA